MDKCIIIILIIISWLLIIWSAGRADATEPVIEELTPILEEVVDVEEEPKNTYLGEFKLTAYCPCTKCCGKNDGITATGTKATAGRTVAVDPKKIPYGTELIINGNTYTAEDCGDMIKENRIDIFFSDHQTALNFGVQYAEVYKVG